MIALDSKNKDYENALLDETSFRNNMNYMVTRNIKDFKKAKSKIVQPKELIKMFS